MPRAAAIASRAALAVLLAAAFLRALVMLEPFPYWSGDPTLINIPLTSLTPFGSLLLDSISLSAAATVLLTEPMLSRRVLWIPFTLVCLGTIGIVVHAWPHGCSLDNLRIGAGWAAALFGGLAAAHAARDSHTARLVSASAIGIVALLAAKGAVQVFIEHAETVEQFRQSKDMFLAAQGWTPGSAAALNFERRLDQPEATCWFGLANVTASFAAASLTALLGWTILAWRETRAPDQRLPSGWSGLLTIGAFAASAALMLAGAKGGYAAAVLGIALLGAAAIFGASARPLLGRALPRLAPALPLALIAAALGALVVRGLIGERLGELSLLFRWFYISTATRVFFLHTLGVGPADFQDAYQLLKPAISPEEVTSPHSVLFDFTATLGGFGIALSVAFLLWASRAGSGLLRASDDLSISPNSPPSSLSRASSRTDLWFILFVSSAPTLISAWIEAPIATPDSTIMRLLGLSTWIGISLAALSLMQLTNAWRAPFAAAAIVLAVHGQIEVTPIWPGSVCLYFLILAAAGVPAATCAAPAPSLRVRTLSALAALPPLALATAFAATELPRVFRWERGLANSAHRFLEYAPFRARYEALRAGVRNPGDTPERLSQEVRAALPANLRSQPQSLELDLSRLFYEAASAADIDLRSESAAAFPAHLPTLLAISRLDLQIPAFEIAGAHPFNPGDWPVRAETIAVQATGAASSTASAWGWLGTLRAARFEMDHDRAHLEQAIAAWTLAAALDPHGLSMPLRLMRAHAQLGNADQARLWAGRALEANSNLRLDPLKQLSSPDLAEVQRLVNP